MKTFEFEPYHEHQLICRYEMKVLELCSIKVRINFTHIYINKMNNLHRQNEESTEAYPSLMVDSDDDSWDDGVNNSKLNYYMECPVTPHPIWCSTRMAIAIVCFFGFLNMYAQRVNISVAMVCMVNHSALLKPDNENSTTNSSFWNVTLPDKDFYSRGEFAWPKYIQGNILGSFFWGYILTQLPGGYLAHRFGATKVLGWSMFACSVATLLIPVGSRIHYSCLMVLRFISGLCQGVVFPAGHVLWSRWCPPPERSRLIGFSFAGTQIGNVLALPISGLLCQYGLDNGWPTIFYFFGAVGVLWFIFWEYIVYDSPESHPRVNQAEADYVAYSLKGEIGKTTKPVPWKSIFTSLPMWGIMVTHTCSTWGIYTFLTNTPTYLKEVLKFDAKSNGFIAALPYILFWIIINISSYIADQLRIRRIISITWIRRIFNALGQLIPIIFLIALANVDSSQTTLAVVFLILGIAFNGMYFGSGFLVNHADIAPSYAGILFGISNTFGTIPGFVAPVVISLLTPNGTRLEWQNVFYLTCGFYTVGALFFLFTGSGDVQEWAKQDEDNKEVPIVATSSNDFELE